MRFAILILAALPCLAATDLRVVEAVKRSDPQAVAALIRQKADVNAVQPDGGTALAWAVQMSDAKVADMLLAAGAKADAANEYGETPLTLAATNGDAALIDKLIKAGANVNAAKWDGSTALMLASTAGSLESVKLLLAKGANVNAIEKNKGQSALMMASAEGHSDVVQYLIDKGADVKAVSKGGFSPLVFATLKNDVKSVKSLLAAGADPKFKLTDGTKLVALAVTGKSNAASLLALAGADTTGVDRTGNTMLHTAAQNGDLEMVKVLIKNGADVNAKTPVAAASAPAAGGGGGGGFGRGGIPSAQTPLLMAAKAGKVEVMKALLAAGADPKYKTPDEVSLLWAAVGSANVEAAKLAYQYDTNVNIVNPNTGATLMHDSVTGTSNGGTLEAQLRVCEVIRFIAEKGAPLDERNKAGKTPIDIADVGPIDKAVELLTELILKSGKKPQSPSLR